jgi:hypothetical protein
MKCEDCNAEIPKSNQQYVELAGKSIPYPYCDSCAKKWEEKIKEYEAKARKR